MPTLQKIKQIKYFIIICLPFLSTQLFAQNKVIELVPSKFKQIGTIDKRFQSYNVEMAEVIGGNFWRPYDKNELSKPAEKEAISNPGIAIDHNNTSLYQAIPPIDLYDKRLRKLAAALGPVYVRVSGTWANTVYFREKDGDTSLPAGFNGYLTKQQWKGVLDYIKAVDGKLVTSFAVSEGVRDAQGVWTPVEATKIINYTKSLGGEIVAAELFNEPNFGSAGGVKGYTEEKFAKDIAIFSKFVKNKLPNMAIVGPGSVSVGAPLTNIKSVQVMDNEKMLNTQPKANFDIFSYHFYGAVSQRCASFGKSLTTSREDAMSENWLARTDSIFSQYDVLYKKYAPGKPFWLTETADAACGGNPWAVTYLDCFRYLDQMGRLAKNGVDVIFHNTFATSEYGMVDQKTHLPRPKYWAALLWHQLIGTKVLDAGVKIEEGVHVYAHSTAGKNTGVTLLILNTNLMQSISLKIPSSAQRYTLSADELIGMNVKLNGKELQLNEKDELPLLKGENVKSGLLSFAPSTITFLVIP
jgi:hypothetical protein